VSLPRTTIKGPKFWAITAAISGLCTLSIFITGLAEVVGFHPWSGASSPRLVNELISILTFLMLISALCAGFVGMASMILVGAQSVGRLEARGRLLPAWVLPLFCGVAYAAPWALLVLIRLISRID
jgi:hypothetical protein